MGYFWEERDEGFNAGVDIFANVGSEVFAIESGVIIDIDNFSNDDEKLGIKNSHFIVVRGIDKINYKYCQITVDSELKVGQKIESGDYLGTVAEVYVENLFSTETPVYVREHFAEDLKSKLHLELYKAPFSEVRPYQLGNYFGEERPKSLLNPQIFLSGLADRTNGT